MQVLLPKIWKNLLWKYHNRGIISSNTKLIVNNCIYISYNFNKSLFDSEFPCKLKEADITPAYKKKRNKENCPPVRTLPNFCKVYERLMYD